VPKNLIRITEGKIRIDQKEREEGDIVDVDQETLDILDQHFGDKFSYETVQEGLEKAGTVEKIGEERPEKESPYARLREKAKAGASTTPGHWDPELDDWLDGKVVATGEGKNNRFAEVEVAEHSVKAREKTGKGEYEATTVEPGESVLLWCSKVLEDLFDQLKAGMRISVQFIGTQKTKRGGNPVKLYDYAFEEA